MKRRTVEEARTEQEARRQDKADRLEKLRAAQIKLYEAKVRLKEAESLPVSGDESKTELLAQIDQAATSGKRALASILASRPLGLSDLMQGSVEVRAFIHRYDLEIAVGEIHSGKVGISQSDKSSRISAARQALQMLEHEARQLGG